MAGCSSDPLTPDDPDDPAARSTWNVIQEQIFEPKCVECHTAGTSFATQSDLVLTADVAYEQLVNVPPANASARADGVVRLGTEGIQSLHRSYLWEKIDATNQEHFFTDHPEYGSLMPLGGQLLTLGELAFIKAWILAGAPETGQVADLVLLDDTTRFQTPEFAPLARPSRGLQFHLGPFEVQPDFEREFFFYEPVDNPEDLFVKQVEITMRQGSHHFILYTYPEGKNRNRLPETQTFRELRYSNGVYNINTLRSMAEQIFFAGTQWPYYNYTFPEGVALRLPAGNGLDLNSHYVNYGVTPTEGEVYANLHTVDRSEVEHVAEILDLNNLDLFLPRRQITTLERTFRFNERRHIFMLFSHAHQHMTEFLVEVDGGPRDGEVVYAAYDWEHPPILELDPPLVLEPGQGLRLIATYNNDTDRNLRFGFLSEDEMMILFGYYY